MNDTQTHIIPDSNEMLNKLAIYTSCGIPEKFTAKIRECQNEVRSIYEDVLRSDESAASLKYSQIINFSNKIKAEKSITYLRTGLGLVDRKEFDSRTIQLFESIEPELIKFLASSPDPDRTLENFVKIIRGTKFPSIWYSELSNKKFFENFLSVCTYSQKAVDILSHNSSFEEFFFSRKVFVKRIDEELENISSEELILLLAFQFTLGLINAEKTAKVLTSFVAQKINLVLNEMNLPYNFMICGLGSFGSECMSFASDIDLIVVADNVQNKPNIQKDFQNFLAKIKPILKPFEIDFKLRPEGKKSQLVWDIINYAEYIEKRARVWEFQTFSKIRFVYGNKNLFTAFKRMITKKVKTLSREYLLSEVNLMYASLLRQANTTVEGPLNIKKTKGSMVTIDFITQFFGLLDSTLYRKMLMKNSYNVFGMLTEIIPFEELETLKKNFIYLRTLSLVVQNIFNSNRTVIPSADEKKLLIALFMKLKDGSELDRKINDIIKSNNLLFEKYVNANSSL